MNNAGDMLLSVIKYEFYLRQYQSSNSTHNFYKYIYQYLQIYNRNVGCISLVCLPKFVTLDGGQMQSELYFDTLSNTYFRSADLTGF